jgi:transposase
MAAVKRRYEISDEEWEIVKDLLPPERTGKPGRPAGDNRNALNGILWIARSGAAWRDLPERYGSWSTLYDRFRVWENLNVFEEIFKLLSVDADMQDLAMDGTIVRAHQDSAGAKKGQ